MLMHGQGRPSGIVGGSGGVTSAQGQPVLPGGGGGRLFKFASSMRFSVGQVIKFTGCRLSYCSKVTYYSSTVLAVDTR